jgi:hypothetical protein
VSGKLHVLVVDERGEAAGVSGGRRHPTDQVRFWGRVLTREAAARADRVFLHI